MLIALRIRNKIWSVLIGIIGFVSFQIFGLSVGLAVASQPVFQFPPNKTVFYQVVDTPFSVGICHFLSGCVPAGNGKVYDNVPGIGHITYSISPSLPSSVTFDPSTGLISGVFKVRFSLTKYIISALGPGGSPTVSTEFDFSADNIGRISTKLVFANYMVCFQTYLGQPVLVKGTYVPGNDPYKLYNNLINPNLTTTDIPAITGYIKEIQQAQAAGIDGFALDVGSWTYYPYYQQRAALIFEAAHQLVAQGATPFRLFFLIEPKDGISPEFTVADIQNIITTYGNDPNYYTLGGKVFLSTWGGYLAGTSWWTNLLSSLEGQGFPIYLVPSFCPITPTGNFYINSSTNKPDSDVETPNADAISQMLATWKDQNNSNIFQGMFYFGAAGVPFTGENQWDTVIPNSLTAAPGSLLTSGELYSTLLKQNNMTFMASFSPFYWGAAQITPQSNNNFGRRYMEYQGGLGVDSLWKDIIKNQNPDWVNIITWNDFHESYISPVNSTDSNPSFNNPYSIIYSNGDKNGYPDINLPTNGSFVKPHGALLDLSAYYVQWYKTGKVPVINGNELFYAYRTHPMNAIASSDNYPVTQFTGNVQDLMYVTVFLTQTSTPAKLYVDWGDGNYSASYSLSAGIQTLEIPFPTAGNSVVGGTPTFILQQGSRTILKIAGEPIVTNPQVYNYFYTTGDCGSWLQSSTSAVTCNAGNSSYSI